ncbi:hypothetical protein CTheo_7537 [Ceratobasidium theobromae]|uniref:Transposase family Tnp2 protein n=1 Tax=Ceratobasidium theobromae TaxID=1582974 RepID=A0A5N5QBA8_9AGAM|nr:hypothetical protein CTheo_7537 [Ceratobasidium theobromae]
MKAKRRVRFLSPTSKESSEALEQESGQLGQQSCNLGGTPTNLETNTLQTMESSLGPGSQDDNPEIQTPASNTFSVRFAGENGIFVKCFPDPCAGVPINNNIAPSPDLYTYVMKTGNLSDPDLFETAKLLMTTGLTSTGRDWHLKSCLYKGKTPWKNNKQLLVDIDNLPHSPEWKVHKVLVRNKWGKIHISYLFTQNIIELVHTLIGNPVFKEYICYSPERHWTAEDCKVRIYSETWSGNWWWLMQVILPDKSVTIVPIIITSNQTTLSTMCGRQQAYPVYITITNISKSLRRKVSSRAMVLLVYLPVDKFLNIADPDERSWLKHKLTHRAMDIMTNPLWVASRSGVEMWCADGHIRRIYPIVAGVIADRPEQCGHACVEESGCPKCKQKRKGHGGYGKQAPKQEAAETLLTIHEVLQHKDQGELEPLGLKPWWPWWANMFHYSESIRAMGTPDGFNSEAPEHLHIEYAKRGWHASNKVEPLPQMIKFIQCVSRKPRKWASCVVYGDEEDGLKPRGILDGFEGNGNGNGNGKSEEGGDGDGSDGGGDGGGNGESDDGEEDKE